MSQNTNTQAGNMNQINKDKGNNVPADKHSGKKPAGGTHDGSPSDPNQIRDPNRDAQKSGDKNHPGHVTGKQAAAKPGNDANRNQGPQGNASKTQ